MAAVPRFDHSTTFLMAAPPGLRAIYDYLARESKRRYPAVRDAATQALRVLDEAQGGRLGEVEDLLANPLLLACNHPGTPPKLVISALSGIQTLATHGLLSPSQHGNVLRVMNLQVGGPTPRLSRWAALTPPFAVLRRGTGPAEGRPDAAHLVHRRGLPHARRAGRLA